jgi:hypothetical protein
MTDVPSDPTRLLPEDLLLLAALGRGNDWLRAVLCTLARRGVALRTVGPDRATALLDALSTWPLYKGGQFLFDLLEWEDFMVDGPPPPVVPTTLDSRALDRVSRLLRQVQGLLDGEEPGSFGTAARENVSITVGAAGEELPLLEPGFYLYRDVVLGIIASAGPVLALGAPLETPVTGPASSS